MSGSCALALFCLYRFLHRPLAPLLPGAPALGSLPSFLIVAASLWLGIESHILWDSFTHEWGWFVRASPLLQANLVTVGSYEVRGFKVAQHASTLIGLAAVVWPLRGWPLPLDSARRKAWAAIFAGAAVWGALAAVDARGAARLFEFVTAATRAGVVLAVAAGVYLGRIMSNRSRVRV